MFDVAGVKVIHRHSPASQVVAVRLFLLGGTRQLTATTQGIEVLLLTAAQSVTRRQMALQGAHSFVEPGLDWTAVGFVSLQRDFAPAWRLLASWLGPVPPDGALDRARGVLVSAAQRRYSHPDLRVGDLARTAAFPDHHPYALTPTGTIESLAAISAADLVRYRSEQFVRSRLLLVIVGAVARAEVESLVSGTLGRLPAGAYVWTMPHAPLQQAGWRVEHRVLPTNYIMAYYLGPGPRDDDYFAFQVATYLLSSRLNTAIRDELSLSYAVFAPFFDYAIPAGGLYASTGNPLTVYRRMQREVSDLKETDLEPFPLRRFLDQFVLERLSEQMTTAGQAEALGRAALYFGDFHMADGAWDKLRRVRPTEVRVAAARYMRDFRLAYLGDTLLMLGRW